MTTVTSRPAIAAQRTNLYGSAPSGARVTTRDLAEAKANGQPWPMLTAYDAITARIFDDLGVPVLLVGDSAATVVYGYDNTVAITVDDLLPLVRAVVRGSNRAMVVADMPFGSYQSGASTALHNAARFLKEGGAHAVKLEGGRRISEQVRSLVESGIPVMGHIGLTPQSVLALGGYRVQGRGAAGDALVEDALALQDAGAFAIVLEVIPADLAERVTTALTIPTIGIGAGSGTDAQVNVWQDLTGLTPGASPKFVKKYADLRAVITDAARAWCDDVVNRAYPASEHTYS
ncbi:MAG: 3-methyl-2-oxobutanoate hydroxymethyltransferase [Actinobacteria bacterium]|nr:3-methyl-2-oxobutanoate hydroxymethyltransferase [Actinomycetota bacterium]